MTRKPVTVTEDQMRLIDTATEIGLYQSRSAFLRAAFRQYFADNEVLVAVLLPQIDGIEIQDIVTAVDADPEHVNGILNGLDVSVDWTPTASFIEEIEEEFTPPESDDSP